MKRIAAVIALALSLIVVAPARSIADSETPVRAAGATTASSDTWTKPHAPKIVADRGTVVKQRVIKTDGVTTSYEAQAGCTEGSIRSATGYLRLGYTKWSDGFIRVDYLTVIGSQSFYLNETDEYSRRVAPLPSVYYVGPWYNTTWATSRTWTRAFSFSDGATQIYAYMRFGLASYWPAYACTVGYSVYA